MKFICHYFILSDAFVNRIVYYGCMYTQWLYVYHKAIVSILYPEILLNWFISFSSFLTDSLESYIYTCIYKIMSSVNDIVLLIFLHWMSFISFYYLIALARTSMLNNLCFQFSEQKYGYYYCKDCSIWRENTYVLYLQGNNKVYFKEFCRTCRSLITLTKWRISPIK